jgi:steroid 5-alpha reductase family enzyme
MSHAMLVSALAIVVLMLSTWVLSIILKNASIVDIVWGLGFVMVAWVVRLSTDANNARQWLLVAMVTVWGLRLAGYLFWRNHGNGEDFRYRAMRKHYGPRFGLISLVTVFALQGALMFVVSLSVQLGQADATPNIGVIAYIGVALWLVGLFFEAVGDAQLARFKADPANQGMVMRTGLWRYTRHPNYFGDFLVWWGIFLIAAESGAGAWGFAGPLLMTLLLVKVSGAGLLEKDIATRRPGYADYVRRTSGFIPRPPRRG